MKIPAVEQCNGKINHLGYCEKCHAVSQTTGGLCSQLYEIPNSAPPVEGEKEESDVVSKRDFDDLRLALMMLVRILRRRESELTKNETSFLEGAKALLKKHFNYTDILRQQTTDQSGNESSVYNPDNITSTYTTCNGKIDNNGRCGKCFEVSQTTSAYCTRLIESGNESRPHPELICKICEGHNPLWSAENELFNKVNGSPYGIMCPVCFDKMAREKSIDVYFRATSRPPKNNSEDVYRWVKASERLPDESGTYCCSCVKIGNGVKSESVTYGWFGIGFKYIHVDQEQYGNVIEWLEKINTK